MNKGYFGEFGGAFVPELLVPALQEVEQGMQNIMPTEEFKQHLNTLLTTFAGRPTPLTLCPTLTARLGFPSIVRFWDCLEALDNHGADIIEIGVPFSDPVADTISRARQAFSLPIALGFGLRDPAQLAALSPENRPDAAIFGSALLEHIDAGHCPSTFLQKWL